jgi:hypothetical protein
MQVPILPLKCSLLLCAGMISATTAMCQQLDGFRIGMSKTEVCRFVEQHVISHILQSNTECPEIDDHVVVVTKNPELPGIDSLNLAFGHNGRLSAIWTTFSSARFDSIYTAAVRKFGNPTVEKYKAGADGIVFTNVLVSWKGQSANVFLEPLNVQKNGEITGWLALNSLPDPSRY